MNRKQRRAAGKPAPIDGLAVATAHYDAGRPDQAEAACRRVLATEPGHLDALNLLAVAQQAQGRLDDAIGTYQRLIGIAPDFAEVHANLGVALWRHGRRAEAIAAYRRAVAIKPDYAEAYCNLGNALRSCDKPEEAAAAYRQAIGIRPGYAEAHAYLGAALQELGRIEEAVAACRRAIGLRPDLAEAHCNLGNALRDQGKYREAAAAYRRSIGLWPDYFVAHANLGNVLRDQGLLTEAVGAYRQAIAVKPDFALAHCNLGNALQDQGRLDEAMAAFRRAIDIDPDYAPAHSNLLMCMHYASSVSATDLHAEALAFGRRHDAASTDASFDNVPDADRRLRIGYVSADFRNHPVGYFLARVLAARDPAAAEIICYAHQPTDDAMTARLRGHADQWRSIIGMSDADAAAMIRRDAIDILVDLGGHTANNRLTLLALRPAPVQATWLGYFDTTGLSAIDYILADRFVAPPGEEDRFSETVWRLPEIYLCYAPHEVAVEPAPPPALANGFVTFGCFNNRAKITDDTVRVWAEVLRRVDGARLFLKNRSLADAAVTDALAGAFSSYGIARERLILEGQSPLPELLAAYNRIDIALDPFPFAGGTTTAEALWMGVPVVTLRGDRWVGRMSEGMLTTVGLADLVAGDEAGYLRIAAGLAADLSRLGALHAGLRRMVEDSPFCDGPRFARALEAAYRGMWRGWCAREPS
jgi:predicted O-linked N-acetylglucosamine transferase (SPINDLY family)